MTDEFKNEFEDEIKREEFDAAIKRIEDNLDNIRQNQEKIEKYLIEKLASDWEKIKYSWEDVLAGKMSLPSFFYTLNKIVGKKVVNVILGMLRLI